MSMDARGTHADHVRMSEELGAAPRVSASQKIWLNFDRFRNCREFNSVWRISLAFANRPILHYGNGLRNIGGEAPPARIKVPSAFGKYAPFSIKAPPAR